MNRHEATTTKFHVSRFKFHVHLKPETRNLELRRMGQTTAEYAILIGVVVGALVAMQIYVRRGTQVKLKVGVDEFTKAGTLDLPWVPAGAGGIPSGATDVKLRSAQAQYEPYYAESSYTTSRTSNQIEDTDLTSTVHTIVRKMDGTEGTAAETTTRKAAGHQTTRTITEAD